MLTTLAYRVPREHLAELLGTVTAYPLTDDFEDAWSTLPGDRPPYSSLATGLVAASGKPVRLFGERELGGRDAERGAKALLLTTDDAFDHKLGDAVRAWERHLRDGGTPVLADLLPTPEATRPFADFIEFRPERVPVAPHWVFRVAAWQIARALAVRPMTVDDRTVKLRMDTDGRLLAWNENEDDVDKSLIVSRSGMAFAMTGVTMRLATRPGVEDLVLTFNAHQSRIDARGAWYQRVWVKRKRGNAAPVLYLPVRGRKVDDAFVRYFDPAIAAILSACDLDPLRIPESFPSRPGDFRPLLKPGGVHALGSGPGPRFMLRLHEHITTQLPLLVPLTYDLDKEIKLPERIVKYPTEGVRPEAIGPTGYKKVTIACLYRTAEARDRMFTELEKLTGRRPTGDTSPTVVHERLELIARHCPDLLDHATDNRAAHLDALNLPVEADHLVAAWVETEYHSEAESPQLDAKPHLRRLFGHLGVPTQFLATEPTVLPDGATPMTPQTKVHAARAALRDLLRSAGVLDDRIRNAVAFDELPHRLDRRTLLVGINARAQHVATGERPFVLTLTAVLADPADLEQWRVMMYSEHRGRWVRAAEGVTDFHADTIGSPHLGRTEEKAELTRVDVERRLRELVTADLRNVSMVVFVDAQSTRSVWPGLQNIRFGDGPLPGDTLRARGDEVSVIRLHADMGDLGRPVTRVGESRIPEDHRQPAAPGKGVYRLADSTVPSWLFAGKSVTLNAKGGMTGARYTRWTLPGHLRNELRKPWHSYTGREIVVVHPGLWEPTELAALAARLCEQPISWDGRTLVPSPLHLGVTADKDHPDYRVSGEPG